MPSLYVTQPGSRLELDRGRLLTVLDAEVIASVPSARVDRVIVVGGATVTTPVLTFLLDRGTDLIFMSLGGVVRGRLGPVTAGTLDVRRQQYRRADDPAFCLHLARAIVAGKLANQRTRCLELARAGNAPAEVASRRLAANISAVPQATTMPELLGLEGAGARAYFGSLGTSLRAPWEFQRRARRPPPDPVNAVLSIMYTLLVEQCRTALSVVGLDPECGFLHVSRSGSPALALDLMEEFRPVIGDPTAWSLFNRRQLKLTHFLSSQGRGVELSPPGWKLVAQEYGRKMSSRVRVPGRESQTTYQKLLEVQAWQIRRLVEGEATVYEPFLAR